MRLQIHRAQRSDVGRRGQESPRLRSSPTKLNVIDYSSSLDNYYFQNLCKYLPADKHCSEILRNYLPAGKYSLHILRNFLSARKYSVEILRKYLSAGKYSFEILRNYFSGCKYVPWTNTRIYFLYLLVVFVQGVIIYTRAPHGCRHSPAPMLQVG